MAVINRYPDLAFLDATYLRLDCTNDPLTDDLQITVDATNAVALYLDGNTNPYTTAGVENLFTDGFLRIWRTVQKTFTNANEDSILSVNALLDANTFTINNGNHNENIYGTYFITAPLNNTISGSTTGKIGFNNYCSNYYGGYFGLGTTIVDAGEATLTGEVNYNVGGVNATADSNITVNNANLNLNYRAYGVRGLALLTALADGGAGANAININYYGVYGSAQGSTYVVTSENAYGGYFLASGGSTLNVGAYVSGDTCGLLSAGHILPSITTNYTIGNSTYEWLEVWNKTFKTTTNLTFTQTLDLPSGDFFTANTDAGVQLTSNNSNQRFMYFEPKIAQGGTAGFTVFEINATKTSEGSGDRLLYKFVLNTEEIYAIDQQGSHRISAVTTGVIGGIADNSATWMSIWGGTFGPFGGTSIELPLLAGSGFYYGVGSNESHYFGGTGGELCIDFNGNLTTPGLVKGNYLETTQYIGIAADQDLISLGTNTVTANGSVSSSLSLTTVTANGLICAETQAATAVITQRVSPRLLVYGRAWYTNGAGASHIQYFTQHCVPLSGDPVTAYYSFGYAPNTGAITEIMRLYYDGALYLMTGALCTEGGRKINRRIEVDTYNVSTTEELIVCNKATAMTVNLPASTNTGRKLYIKNINVGVVTIDGNAGETIDGNSTIALSQWEAVQIVDYATGVWCVV